MRFACLSISVVVNIVHYFPIAIITNYHAVSSLKQLKFIILGSVGLKSMKIVASLVPLVLHNCRNRVAIPLLAI